MRWTNRGVGSRYAEALRDHLAGGGEAALQRAYELGRQAITDGLGLLDLVALHHETLEEILKERPAAEQDLRVRKAAEAFLAESLSPFEMTHRGFREAVSALRRLNQVLEEEARRIAHALHDEAGQLLASVHLAVEEVARDLPPRARGRLREVRGLLDKIEMQLRHLSHELRPTMLDDLGLIPALEFLAQGVAARTGIPIAVNGPRDQRLPPLVETALYRVVQEALNNATRHARPRRVEIQVRLGPGAVHCTIGDDGQGFDVPSTVEGRAARGLGLIGIRERLSALRGQLTIDSAPGRGTELSIAIPLEVHDANSSASR
jgi:signal transduction histidine kinase